ncbi:TRAP transporter large permease [Cognatazoarcus halotolerans]|uniref:TRAP transporter large permease n=1 Tax=Cognatazoarcus halotolerans TaxID=2686016 RepID=UPI0013597AFD|nr:TRAP transporter large permease subunit [Cognatazoarcus halotolerans]MCB1900270.1 TRAP transporter large permease subunit [Rhodocyclaceae bacterium]MCP5310931.1 TRAP transporter large permease subunit [Zoogloeaceae bacterium]
MTASSPPLLYDAPSERAGIWWRLHKLEDLVLSFVLAAMVVLPLTEIVLRSTLSIGIANAATLVQHCVLLVGMLGAAVAAREGRLLAMGGLATRLPTRLQPPARIFAAAVAIAVSATLASAAIEFVSVEREGANLLAYGIPLWLVQAAMPLGFALIAARLLVRSAEQRPGRALALILAAGLWWLLQHAGDGIVTPGLALVLVAAALGAPVFIVLGGIALVLFAGDDLPLAAIPLNHYQLTVNPSLPAIPLFTLAGYFLAEGGAPQRLIRVFRALFGGLRGGAALVTVLLTAFFTSFTGASGVTILALGGLLLPLLGGVRYPERAGIGLITSGCSLGVLMPPALPLILFAIIARQPIETMLLAAIVPAAAMTAMLIALGIWRQPRDSTPQAFDRREALAAIGDAKWELAIPLVTFGGLASGLVTPTETAALTALYAFIVEVVIYRDLSVRRDVPRVMAECGLLVGGIILILGMALAFTNYLIDAQIAEQVSDWVQATIHSPWVFLLALNLLLLLVGAFMDIFSAIIVVTPLIVPIGKAFGIDPVHLGVIFLANMELGFLTPPVGMNLFFASYRFGKPIGEVARAVLPALGVLAIGVLLVTYLPALSLFLPRALGH